MSLDDLIRHRRSIRRYLPDPVPVTELREMLALASSAPSIGNRQMWRFIVLNNADLRGMLVTLVERCIDDMASWPEFAGQTQRIRAWKEYALHFASAPVTIFIVNQGYHAPVEKMLTERGMRFGEVERLFGYPDVQSVSAVAAYLTLLAEERGYGTCWMTDPLIAKKDLQAALNIKSGEELVMMMTMGKAADFPPPKPRKPIDDIIEWRS